MITLDENHVYHDESGPVPGVTGILKEAGLIDDRWFDEYSRERGTLVHRATAMWDAGTLDVEALDPVLAPYVRAWSQFKMDSGFTSDLIEHIVYNPIHRYAGTLDRRGYLDSQATIVDIKTGVAQPWAALQTAAYAGTFDIPHKRATVELCPDCTYKLTMHTDRNDIRVFLSALAVTNWKANNE